ncbi:zinc-finger homeodomain protein 6-like [Primulina huaijiensis]|uniref:zinc-finger homeodomain protein 6-like n=1 Tax=Primulina huaijiensis TaxID=1492673 RepID=UPI003CC78525
MEHRGMQSSISFNAPQINKESTLKLPLAPIVSAPLERRGNAAVSSRRGSAIFSPTQTLDQPPQQLFAQKYPTPDPDPATMKAGGASNPNTPVPRRPLAVPTATSTSADSSTKYIECLKNHAASMGNYVVDGCGEFMPGGQEGTFESMRCAACNCHRSFHRRVDAEVDPHHPQISHSRRNPPAIETYHHHQPFPASHTHPIMMNFGGNSGGATAESSNEDFSMFQSSAGGHAIASSTGGSKKRFRTKFNQEQKDKMNEFADKLGWRIQRKDDEQVQQFCNEFGVKRQVFKVWMHNKKQATKKKQI